MNVLKAICDKCGESILAYTKIKTDGYCMPCHYELENEKRERFIVLNKKTVDPYEGLENPQDIFVVMHRKRNEDPLVNELPYPISKHQIAKDFSEDEFDALVQRMCEFVEGNNAKQAINMAITLKRSCNHSLDPFLKVLLRTDSRRCEDWLFYKASPEIREILFKYIELDPDTNLTRLAWIGDDKVVEQFKNWTKKKPAWTENLHISPDEYATCAGWEIADDGSRRDLCSSTCVSLVNANSTSMNVPLITPGSSSCLNCKKEVINLIELKANQIDWLDMKSDLQLPICKDCIVVSDYMPTIESDGRWILSSPPPLIIPPSPIDGYEYTILQLGEPRSCLYSLHEDPTENCLSQIGGYPNWWQDPIYPKCENCNSRMKFFAQLDGDLFNGPLGLFYCFLCSDCHSSAAVVFQCT